MHVGVVAGGSAIAQGWIGRCVSRGWDVTTISSNPGPLPLRERVTHVLRDRLVEHMRGRDKFDHLVTFPGYVWNDKLASMHDILWSRVIDDCLTSVFRALRDCKPWMAPGSAVTVIGSIVGSTGGMGCANYAAAKAGLLGLVRAAANEWVKEDIRVNLLELGYVDAGMGARLEEPLRSKITQTIPLGRFLTLDEALDGVDFLQKAFMTGGVLTLAGGLR